MTDLGTDLQAAEVWLVACVLLREFQCAVKALSSQMTPCQVHS